MDFPSQSFAAAQLEYYVLTLGNQALSNPNNTDAMGNCCNDTEEASNCTTPCAELAFICIRPIGYSLSSDGCPIITLSSKIGNNPNIFINEPYMVSTILLILLLLFIMELNDIPNACMLFWVCSTGWSPDTTSHTWHGSRSHCTVPNRSQWLTETCQWDRVRTIRWIQCSEWKCNSEDVCLCQLYWWVLRAKVWLHEQEWFHWTLWMWYKWRESLPNRLPRPSLQLHCLYHCWWLLWVHVNCMTKMFWN